MIPDFLFCENKSALPGAGLILSTKAPFWIGQLIKFDSKYALEDFQRANPKILSYGKPYHYNILIAGIGCLKDDLRFYDTPDEVAHIYRLMADFYLENNIKNNETRFKRYHESL